MTITDSEAVGNLPDGRGALFHTLTTPSRIVPKAEWDVKRIGWISVPPEWFAENKAVVEKLCHSTQKCDYKMQQNLERVFRQVGESYLAAHKGNHLESGRLLTAEDFQFNVVPWGGASPDSAATVRTE